MIKILGNKMVSKRKRKCCFDMRYNCLDSEVGNCGDCKIGKKLEVKRFKGIIKVQ